jgi:hypothetical protein
MMTGAVPRADVPASEAGKRQAPSNAEVAAALDEVAGLLDKQRANPFRSSAYRHAAAAVRGFPQPLVHLVTAGGTLALLDVPGIGRSLAHAITEFLYTGRLGLLERLRGEVRPEVVLGSVPGIGPGLARRIHERLGVETLEELEIAAHDGRLATVPGFGERRVQGIRETLAGRLGRSSRQGPAVGQAGSSVPVAELLDVDRQYREEAAAGRLAQVAPRRFNPQHRTWLPILHTSRASRHYTALFSNTARAHGLGRTRDWVVIYRDDGLGERQWTVVTETRGPLTGLRVVRGHEPECLRHYDMGSERQ